MWISAVKRSVMIAGGGEPARRIEQIGNGLLNRGELEAFDGAVFIAGDGAFVLEGPVVGLAVGEGRGGSDANGAVGGALAGEKFAGVVGDLGDLEGGMKAKADLSAFSGAVKVTMALAGGDGWRCRSRRR